MMSVDDMNISWLCREVGQRRHNSKCKGVNLDNISPLLLIPDINLTKEGSSSGQKGRGRLMLTSINLGQEFERCGHQLAEYCLYSLLHITEDRNSIKV